MNNVISIYTDGGCSGNGKENNVGGWGALLMYRGHTKEFYGGETNTTNNRMELQACIEALKRLNRFDIPVEVYVDSQYVEQGVNAWVATWEKNGWKTSGKPKKDVENQDLWKELITLKRQVAIIRFIKVKGHADNVHNNKADELAQLGIDQIKKGE